MGMTTAPEWSAALLANGKIVSTPVAILRRCSWPDQETLFTTLGEVGAVIESRNLRPPAVIIVGEVARTRNVANWFTTRPLFGRTVLVTRPEHQSQGFAARLRGMGANVLYQPAIEISAPQDTSALDRAIARLREFDWLVFSSANGVHYFFERLRAKGLDARQLGNTRLAAIGPATVAALAERQLAADLQPDSFRAEALAEALAPHAKGKRFLLARASRGREMLAEMLTNAGASVEQVVVYESRDVAEPKADVAEALAAGEVDWTTVTSSAIAHSLVTMFGVSLQKTQLAAISPVTANTLTELGYPPAVVADVFTTAGLAEALLAAESCKP
jgi:uroporphyrinogen III methyltransferase/synthase